MLKKTVVLLNTLIILSASKLYASKCAPDEDETQLERSILKECIRYEKTGCSASKLFLANLCYYELKLDYPGIEALVEHWPELPTSKATLFFKFLNSFVNKAESAAYLQVNGLSYGEAHNLVRYAPAFTHDEITSIEITNTGEIPRFIQLYKRLTSIKAEGCVITHITYLSNLKGLTSIVMKYTCVRDFTPLQSLPSLRILCAAHNRIEKITGIEYLTNLVKLDLSTNKIENIEKLSCLTKLKSLDISDNKILSFESLVSLSKLKVVWIFENPATTADKLEDIRLIFSYKTNIFPHDRFNIVKGRNYQHD